MKTFLRLTHMALFVATALALSSSALQAQSPSPEDAGYDSWKLSQSEVSPPSIATPLTNLADLPASAQVSSSGLLVPYPGDGGWTALSRNDDSFTGLLPLGFDFNIYGTTFDEACVNNNGNISFERCFSTYSATGFPSSDYRMVAPFWADVDTRNQASGLAYYKRFTYNGQPAFVAHYEAVGYYNAQADKLNTFQVVITEDAILPGGNNVCFGYGDMEWTTGSASGGSNGFGGVPATVGVNRGDGVNFFQYGRFDKPGTDYDGPGGSTDGVEHLSGQTICVNTGASATNVPPVVSAAPASPIAVDVGDPVNFTVRFIPPELDQIITLSATLPAWLSCTLTDSEAGGTASAVCSGTPSAGGTYTASITATDDGTPSLSTTRIITIEVRGGEPVCLPSEFTQRVDRANRRILLAITDPEGITRVDFTDDMGAPVLVNLMASSPQMTSSDGIHFEPNDPANPPTRADFELEATADQVRYFARIQNECGTETVIDPPHNFAASGEDGTPTAFAVDQNYPNPFHEQTSISFQMTEPGTVRVTVYDFLGREVVVLHDALVGVGSHTVIWDGRDAGGQPAASGTYLYRVHAGSAVETRRMTLINP